MEYAIHIGLKTTNNKAEYEALLIGLNVIVELEVWYLELVVNQVQGDYLTKDLRMVAYLDEVKVLVMKIKNFKIQQILREENKQVDFMENLVSTFDFITDRNILLEFLPRPSIDATKTNVC